MGEFGTVYTQSAERVLYAIQLMNLPVCEIEIAAGLAEGDDMRLSRVLLKWGGDPSPVPAVLVGVGGLPRHSTSREGSP